jgi:nanoRNase/pAp phosphatase (c-di-AMP/oligoRNAs hydrolase)
LYEKNSKRTFEIVSKLLEIGADKKKIVDNIFRNNSYSSILLLKEILNNI